MPGCGSGLGEPKALKLPGQVIGLHSDPNCVQGDSWGLSDAAEVGGWVGTGPGLFLLLLRLLLVRSFLSLILIMAIINDKLQCACPRQGLKDSVRAPLGLALQRLLGPRSQVPPNPGKEAISPLSPPSCPPAALRALPGPLTSHISREAQAMPWV
jgi:hypothetical protein